MNRGRQEKKGSKETNKSEPLTRVRGGSLEAVTHFSGGFKHRVYIEIKSEDTC